MNAGGDQCAVLAKDLLRDHAPAVACPRALHLVEHPLVSPDLAGLVEVDGVVERDHHAHDRLADHVPRVAPETLPLVQGADFGLDVGGQVVVLLGVEGEAPEAVDARDGPDEVRIGDVGEGGEVGRRAAGNLAARPEPLARLLLVRVHAVAVDDLDAVALERPLLDQLRLAVKVVGRRAQRLLAVVVVVATAAAARHR